MGGALMLTLTEFTMAFMNMLLLCTNITLQILMMLKFTLRTLRTLGCGPSVGPKLKRQFGTTLICTNLFFVTGFAMTIFSTTSLHVWLIINLRLVVIYAVSSLCNKSNILCTVIKTI